MVTRYAKALEAMTASCDLYREAAESALAALAEATGGGDAGREAVLSPAPTAEPDTASPLKALTKTLGLFRGPNR